MRTYKVTINTSYANARLHVFVRTSAKTDAGLARAIGKQIAKSYKSDIFEVVGMLWREGVASDYSIRDWHNASGTLRGIERDIWRVAHEAIMCS